MVTSASRLFTKRLQIIVLAGLFLCLLVYFVQDPLVAYLYKDRNAPKFTPLRVGGTSVAAFLVENRWRAAYQKAKGIDIVYDSTGSTQGADKMINKEYVIAFTHARMNDKQRSEAQARGGEVVHVPVVICAVVPLYNVKELKNKPPLKFSGQVLANIFLGKIERWNDPALKGLNEGVELPNTKITVVHRNDSSGTTFIFTDFLAGASPAWSQAMGPPGNNVPWRVGLGADRNHGVADLVYRTDGAIGYTDLLYSTYGNYGTYGKLQYGAVQNKDRTDFIHASAKNMTAAVHGMLANIPEDLTFPLTNVSGRAAYPICGAVWAVCYRDQPAANQQKVVDFLQWITHQGQDFAADMSYARLPEELAKRAEERIKSIKQVK